MLSSLLLFKRFRFPPLSCRVVAGEILMVIIKVFGREMNSRGLGNLGMGFLYGP